MERRTASKAENNSEVNVGGDLKQDEVKQTEDIKQAKDEGTTDVV